MRTQDIKKTPLQNVMGGDLLTTSSLILAGKVCTLANTCLHRRGGSSSNGKTLAKSMALPWLDQYLPRISLAYNVFQHITAHHTFAHLTKPQRYRLANSCVSLAFYKKIMTILFKQRYVERAGIPDSVKYNAD